MNKTKFLTKEEALAGRKWFHVDATGKTLGRISTEVAILLRGKHKTTYTPHNDCGDFVVITNAEKVKLTGNKLQDKMYFSHSGHIGNLRKISAGALLEKHPTRLLEKAIKRMLPKSRLGDQLYTKLKVYAGEEHPHHAQQPTKYEFKYI